MVVPRAKKVESAAAPAAAAVPGSGEEIAE